MEKEVNIYLFVPEEYIRRKSSKLFQYFSENEIKIKFIAWNGTLSGLHRKEDRNTGKVMVCYSTMLTECTEDEVKRECHDHGYFLFYGNSFSRYYEEDQMRIFDDSNFLEEVEKFLA